MRLEKRSAVVTGAATGIGRAIAIAMAAEGASVAIDYVGNPELANEVVAEIAKSGGTAIAVAADVSKSSEANALVAAAVKAFGGLDVFVNNAGIEYRYDFLDTPDDSWEKTLAVDLSGPFYCSRAAGKQMVAQGRGGRIINISSIHEDVVFQQHAPYCAAKGGVRMLMRTIAVELAKYKITCNNIAPGAIFTPIDKDVQANPKLEAELLAEIPLARWGQPEEIAAAAVFLASDEAAYITGTTLVVDGGMMRQSGNL
jgi:glucose 1-dehydrogenase